MHSNVCKEVFRKRLIVEASYTAEVDERFLESFLIDLSREMGMSIINGPFISSATGKAKPIHEGYEGVLVWAESGVNTYVWTKFNFCTVDIYSCKEFDTNKAIDFIKRYFKISDLSFFEIPDPILKEDSRIEVRTSSRGKGVFASEHISANTALSYIDGQVFRAEKESDFATRKDESSYHIRNHAVPFHKNFYRNSFNSSGVIYNHSCNPNCYVKDLFFITTIRDILPGEELTVSYSLFCNSDWEVPEGKCLCGEDNCLGEIVPWRKLPLEHKLKYFNYTADWILFEEMKERGFLQELRKTLE